MSLGLFGCCFGFCRTRVWGLGLADEKWWTGTGRSQVLANGLVGTLLSVGVAVMTGWQDVCLESQNAPLVTAMMAGVLGHYACCNGDTWSSEVGVLSKSPPRLITSFKASSCFQFSVS